MKKTLATLLALVALMAAASSSYATPVGIGVFSSETPGDVHRCWTATPFATFTFYIVGFELGSFTGWEASISYSAAGLTILGYTLFPGTALEVGAGNENFIVGLGAILNGTPRFTLVSAQAGVFVPTAPTDLQICLGPATPSSFPSAPGPGYANNLDQLIPLTLVSLDTGIYGAGCAVVNASNLANCQNTDFSLPPLEQSFGEMKARY